MAQLTWASLTRACGHTGDWSEQEAFFKALRDVAQGHQAGCALVRVPGGEERHSALGLHPGPNEPAWQGA